MISILRMTTIVAQPRADNSRVLAGFDALIVGLRVASCVIVLMPDGNLVAQPPSAKTRRGDDRVVRIVDPDLDAEFQTVALAAYHTIRKGVPHVA
jgi:hypothetical protein